MSRTIFIRLTPLFALATLLSACGGSGDDALNQFGAADANVEEIEVVLHDDRITDGAGNAGGFKTIAHTDLTFLITNEGTVPHGLSLYADAARTQLLTASPEIEPGGSATVRFHFHDAQTAHLQDDRYPDKLQAVLIVVVP